MVFYKNSSLAFQGSVYVCLCAVTQLAGGKNICGMYICTLRFLQEGVRLYVQEGGLLWKIPYGVL